MQLKFDNEISISIGKNRKEMHWKNRDMLWSLFVEKLSRAHPTPETLAEYLKADKSRQAEIKDIGGFVGGTLTGGRRKSDTVASRSIVTLDVDNASKDFWENFTLFYDNAAAVYATHKYSPDKPRLRLILPLSRPVTPDEYVAISRRIAGNLGIEQFDDTTYEPERLMYWPSTPKDIEYYFQAQDGPWLQADEILATYHNYRDASEWPVSDREGDAIRREIKKQADPLEKNGIVGVFCRTYDIHKAIETFLSDVYESCDMDNRYTYKEGSTAAGLIVYDDKFAYSHHGTDPAGRMLCNAFDLVRIHKFGNLDEDVKDKTNITKYPSYLAMEGLCTADKETRRTLATEKLKSAGEDFEGILTEDEDDSWLEEMEADRKGNYLSTLSNIRLILEHDPKLRGQIRRDEFNHMDVIVGNVPWRTPRNKFEQFWKNSDDACLRCYLEADPWRISGMQKIYDALEAVLEANKYHPIREYLNGLNWDGFSRLDRIFIDYLGAPDTELIKTMTRKAFTAAVARVMCPGTKFDYVVVIIGTQGIGKSTILKKMGKDWFSDSFIKVDGKEAMEQLQGAWIMEIGELAGLKKAEVESIKDFISKDVDMFRVAYGRKNEKFPRQTVFFGTTNEDNFLRDATGNRRFWPITTDKSKVTKSIWEDLTDDEIDQLWAEAVQRYRDQEPLYLPKNLEQQARELQECHAEIDERKGLIEEFLNIKLPVGWDNKTIEERRVYILQRDELSAAGKIMREKVCAVEILNECFGEKLDERTRYRTREINMILRSLPDWEARAKTSMGPYGQQRYFKRTVDETKDDIIFD